MLKGFLGNLKDRQEKRLGHVSEQKEKKVGKVKAKFERKMEKAPEKKKEKIEAKLEKKEEKIEKRFAGRAFKKFGRWGMPKPAKSGKKKGYVVEVAKRSARSEG